MPRRKLEAPDDARVFRPAPSHLPWRAQYGLELMRICREADALSKRVGRFVPHVAPTEDEFRALLRSTRARKIVAKREILSTEVPDDE